MPKREADLAVSWFSTTTPSLKLEPLFAERHSVYCGAGHALFASAPDGVDGVALEQADWVRRAYPMPRTLHFARPAVSTVESHDVEGIAHFVLAGSHVGYLPDHHARPCVEAGALRPIQRGTFGYELPMQLAAREDVATDRRVDAVREAILAAHGPPAVD